MTDDDGFVTALMWRRLVAEVDGVKAKISAGDQRFTQFHRKDYAELATEVGVLHRIVKSLVENQKTDGQPDWLGNRDPEKTREMLGDVWQWVDEVGRPYGLTLQPCWPWHRGAIGVLLAACQHYGAALAGSREESLTDFLTRHLEAVEKRVKKLTPRCNGEEHYVGDETKGWTYALDDDGILDRLVGWYAEGGEGFPPGLTPYESGGL